MTDSSGFTEAPNTWSERTLGELVTFFNGDRSDNYPKHNDYVAHGIPFVNTGHITANGRLMVDQFISRACFNRLRGGKLKPNDIVYCLRGSTIGKTARVDITEGSIASSLVIIRSNKEVNQDFIYHFLTSSAGQKLVRQHDNGSAQPNLSVATVARYPVLVPPLAEQRAIARILGALDDKIELNRQMNETLEALARALFQSWFVDFDPVRAKMRGEQPVGMDAATAALFPSRLVQTEHGEVPEGWSLVALSDAAELNPSLQLSRASPAPYVEMSSLPTRGSRPTEWPLREVGSGARFMNGDTLFARITPCLENGKTGFVDFLREGEVGWGSTEYVVIRPRAPLPTGWGYLLAREPTFREFAAKKMEGTTGRQRVAANALARYIVCLPHKTIAQVFGEVIQPIFKKFGANDDESKTLAATRDLLLPRLLSGELRVPDAERLVAVAG